MRSASVLAALICATAVGGAGATTIDWGVHSDYELGALNPATGAFQDTILLTLPSPGSLASTTVANNLRTALNLENGTVSLYREAGDLDALVGSYSFDGTTGSTWHSYLGLPAGDYYYSITGMTTGSSGGFYSISSTTEPTPTPTPPGPNTSTTDWGVHGTVEIGAFFSAPGSFANTLAFTLPSPTEIASTTVANNLQVYGNLEDGMVSLYRENGASDLLIGSYSFDGSTGSTWHSYLGLSAGDYYYLVTGTATGAEGAFYSVSSSVDATLVEKVSAPGTLPLLLAALGLLGVVRRRPS